MSDEMPSIDLVADGLERITDAEKFMKLSRSAIYHLMDSGELPYIKIGRARLIPHRALVELAARYLTATGTQVAESSQSKSLPRQQNS